MFKRLLGVVAASAMTASILLPAAPASAQVYPGPVYAPGAYAPVGTTAFATCPMYGNGMWLWNGSAWTWCPPASVAMAPVGQAALVGYYGFGTMAPPPTIAVAPMTAAPVVYVPVAVAQTAYPSYGYPQQYGYSPYGYNSYPTYGYGYPQQYGYG